jgi:hypothetical protein
VQVAAPVIVGTHVVMPNSPLGGPSLYGAVSRAFNGVTRIGDDGAAARQAARSGDPGDIARAYLLGPLA